MRSLRFGSCALFAAMFLGLRASAESDARHPHGKPEAVVTTPHDDHVASRWARSEKRTHSAVLAPDGSVQILKARNSTGAQSDVAAADGRRLMRRLDKLAVDAHTADAALRPAAVVEVGAFAIRQYSSSVLSVSLVGVIVVASLIVGLLVVHHMGVAPQATADILAAVDQQIINTRRLTHRLTCSGPVYSAEFTQKYKFGKILGEGAFGVVYEADCGPKKVAVKVVDLEANDMETVLEEIDMLRAVAHASLTVSCLDLYEDACFYYIVMPAYSGDLSGALALHLKNIGYVPEDLFVRLSAQMAQAIDFVHSRDVIHRDVKPENYLIERPALEELNNNVALTDFGLSAKLDPNQDSLTEFCGTPVFFAPEIFEGQYAFEVDVFALGLSAFILFEGAFAFQTEMQAQAWAENLTLEPPLPGDASEETLELCRRMLKRRPEDRATAAEVATGLQNHHLNHENTKGNVKVESRAKPPPTDAAVGQLLMRNIPQAVFMRRRWMMQELCKQDTQTDIFSKSFNREWKVGVVKRYEWFNREDCRTMDVETKLNDEGLKLAPWQIDGAAQTVDQGCLQSLRDGLKDHGVDFNSWGSGESRSLECLTLECQQGLCLIAHQDSKTVVRVIDCVAVRVTNAGGAVLFHSGATRPPHPEIHKDGYLPCTKRLPWENVSDAARRLLADIGLAEKEVDLYPGDKMTTYTETNSVHYPGIQTMYRRYELEAELIKKVAPNSVKTKGRVSLKLPAGREEFEGPRGAMIWRLQAITEETPDLDDTAQRVQRVRNMAMTPIKQAHLNSVQICMKLAKFGLDVAKWEEKHLSDLCKEIEDGEADLVEHQGDNGERKILRVVRVTVLRLLHTDKVLLEAASEEMGITKTLNRLPAVKQRCNEHPFLAVRRHLMMHLGVGEDTHALRFEQRAGGQLSEYKDPKKLPGLNSLYIESRVVARLVNASQRSSIVTRGSILLPDAAALASLRDASQ